MRGTNYYIVILPTSVRKAHIVDISRKTDYSLRMLAELVKSESDIVSVRTAAEKNSIPYSFARSIQHDLVRAGIIESARGSHGGMKLSVDPKKITILEIIEAIQGPVAVAACGHSGVDGGPCPFRPECHYNPVWCEAEHMLRDYFKSVTLYQVVCERLHPVLSKESSFELVGPKSAPKDTPSTL